MASNVKKESTTRKHHYLSQFYLKNFAHKRSEEFWLFCFNKENGDTFKSNIKNIACERDFNTPEINANANPEQIFSDFEREVSQSLSEVARNISNFLRPHNQKLILDYMALTSVKNPFQRHEWIEQNKNSLGAKYPTDYYLLRECDEAKKIVTALKERHWSPILAPDDEYFVTGDRPISIFPSSSPLIQDVTQKYQNQNSLIFFPLSKKIALCGSYDEESRVISGDTELVSRINSCTFNAAQKQIFSYTEDFRLAIPEEDGSDCITTLKSCLDL